MQLRRQATRPPISNAYKVSCRFTRFQINKGTGSRFANLSCLSICVPRWRRRQVHPSVEPQVPVPMQVLPSTEPQIPLPQTNSASWTSTPQHLQTTRPPNPPSSIMPDAQLESKVSAIYDTQCQPSTTMPNARSDVLEFLLDESNNQLPASRNSDSGIIQWHSEI